MKSLVAIAQEELSKVNKALEKNERNLANLRNVPPSNLRAIKKGMTYQYYLKTSEDKQSRYLKKSERHLAENRAQLDYELNIQRVLKNQQKILNNLISRYNENSVEDTYRCLCEGRKNIVQPIQMPIEQYIYEWKKSYEVNKNSIPMKVQYETVNGEMIRSKYEEAPLNIKVVAAKIAEYL
ncbi:hypothetical protein SAMN04487831_104197 [Pseudobutyrivibrio sp. UC1225]|uniref:hypothetical protein n=1 Tax=Pseudobutyrivibrio sp. UC1225 TaxID=1798185 RepID=UPI0008E0B75F|nr:hypothetical protein [Pseudobutyrivibrio sp. UC1225]SFN87960.1 hypothetical protein SAMN04487831_104197 [Pseudobutyrivibrio sp. UC1225]